VVSGRGIFTALRRLPATKKSLKKRGATYTMRFSCTSCPIREPVLPWLALSYLLAPERAPADVNAFGARVVLAQTRRAPVRGAASLAVAP
jgi:hypothetical protein